MGEINGPHCVPEGGVRSRLRRAGSSAILFMGSASAVRDPLIGYGATPVAVDKLDMTAGPLTTDYPFECSAVDNLIHDIGYPEKQVAGVAIDMSEDITVSHNSIYNMPRAGINVGDGCWRGHIISYNDVFSTVLETSDHGAYNSWGRDRYWQDSTSAINTRVAAAPGIEYLDAMKPITMANNRWRCDHGWDVDLDDGSTNYVFTNNVFLSGGLKWREGYSRVGDNNVFASAGFSIQLWPTNNQDVFAQIENLIGLDEQSATGLGSNVGVFVVTVPVGSQAATDGFLPIDVILEFNNQSVASLDDLNTLYATTTAGQKVPVGVHRNQMDIVMTITR
jgi:hypothetical protein